MKYATNKNKDMQLLPELGKPADRTTLSGGVHVVVSYHPLSRDPEAPKVVQLNGSAPSLFCVGYSVSEALKRRVVPHSDGRS